jgi:hypothetical protein
MAMASLEIVVKAVHYLAALNSRTLDEIIGDYPVNLLDLAYADHKRDLQLLKGKILSTITASSPTFVTNECVVVL